MYIQDALDKEMFILGSDDVRDIAVDDCLDKTWDFIDNNHGRNFVPILGADPATVEATRKIIEKARDSKAPPLPMMVAELDADVVKMPGDYLDEVILLGVDGAPAFPMAASLRHEYGGDADPKYVRVDTAPSYREFRTAQSPEMAALRQRVGEMEDLLRAHLADPHAHHETVAGYLDDISRLGTQADPAAKRIPLSMPPWAEGKYDCWREGDLICCSIALPGNDGHVRICTSATPIKKHVDLVVGYAQAVGAKVSEMLGVLPTVACMMGGGFLIPQMAKAAPQLLARPEVVAGGTFVGRLVPANIPSFAALIALLQRAQSGNETATAEWERLADVAASEPELTRLMVKAQEKLLAAQGGLR